MNRYRLGVPVKLMGAPLRSHDSRRWQNRPHLSVSIAYLRDILRYLHAHQIGLYRIAGQFAPYLTHPSLPAFHNQIAECEAELAAVGELARKYNVRLTMHPGHYIQLGSMDPDRVTRSRRELSSSAALLDSLGAGPDAIIVIHVGGRYDNKIASRERFVRACMTIPPQVRRRLALENDDRIYDLEDVLWIHRRTGLRVVLDILHHRCCQSCGRSVQEALEVALQTWPSDQRPKIHLSSSRTSMRVLRNAGHLSVRMPLPNQHSDFIDPFDAISILRAASLARVRPFDLMLEAKAKDLALLRLREQIYRFAPELAKHIQ